jgi:ElaB/YqjD/DUF883 family membrane-anchored ribosome-binding protein
MEFKSQGNTPSHSGKPNGTEDALSKASSSAHAAVDSIAGAVGDAASKAKPAIHRAATMSHDAVDKAAGAAGQTAEWLSGRADELNARQEKLMTDSRDYVSANPLKAVGIAVVAGFLLSRLFF